MKNECRPLLFKHSLHSHFLLLLCKYQIYYFNFCRLLCSSNFLNANRFGLQLMKKNEQRSRLKKTLHTEAMYTDQTDDSDDEEVVETEEQLRKYISKRKYQIETIEQSKSLYLTTARVSVCNVWTMHTAQWLLCAPCACVYCEAKLRMSFEQRIVFAIAKASVRKIDFVFRAKNAIVAWHCI